MADKAHVLTDLKLEEMEKRLSAWEPGNSPALWTEICESHTGTLADPIPYSGNMALESGKYYIQDGVVYRCTRDTINPVYNALTDLVGLYVEKA